MPGLTGKKGMWQSAKAAQKWNHRRLHCHKAPQQNTLSGQQAEKMTSSAKTLPEQDLSAQHIS
jgi:hypothetical protein